MARRKTLRSLEEIDAEQERLELEAGSEALEYISKSSIDSPPRDEPAQAPLFEELPEAEPQRYDLEMALRIKPQGAEQAYVLPVLKCRAPKAEVETVIRAAVERKAFTTVLRAVTGYDGKVEENDGEAHDAGSKAESNGSDQGAGSEASRKPKQKRVRKTAKAAPVVEEVPDAGEAEDEVF